MNKIAIRFMELKAIVVIAEMSREMYHGRLLGVTNSVALNR